MLFFMAFIVSEIHVFIQTEMGNIMIPILACIIFECADLRDYLK